MSATRVPTRAEVRPEDTWNLASLFPSDAAWEAALADWTGQVDGYARFRGTLGGGPAALAACLRFDTAFDRLGSRVFCYSQLRESEDLADDAARGMKARAMNVVGRAAEAASFIRPEVLALPDDTLQHYLHAPELADYKLVLERLARYKPHTLSTAEERLLAMQTELTQTPREVFGQLTNTDLTFGDIEIAPGERIELSHASYARCLEHPDREVRRTAFHQYYRAFADHANTLAAAFAGSVKQDVYFARARNHPSARAAALFPDNVPETVYDNLVAAVRANLPAVHRYYEVRRRAMGLDALHFYDTYVPILTGFRRRIEWGEAVELVLDAVRPLGADYVGGLAGGLRGRWCDRYENKNKRSGAFSSGCYDSDPYILMNYEPEVLDHVFTLAHEAGHSMHTQLSKGQPYQYADYTIFVAEVASTFNEQLLFRRLADRAADDRERAYLLNRQIDAMRGTIVRQTMFAEFEARAHAMAEAERPEPLTVAAVRGLYRELLTAYLGPGVVIDDELTLEGLRIPHFYGAFYVYKYATGLSAAIALAERVTTGGAAELTDYLNFLKGGSSKDPLDLLRAAGVDMETPQPVDAALRRFGELVDELDGLLT